MFILYLNAVFRIGRTARGGSKGTAYTFLTAKNILNNEAMSGLVGVLKRCEQEIPQGLSVSHQQPSIYLYIYLSCKY